MHKDKGYLQMLREILAKERRIQLTEDSGDYAIGLQFPSSQGGTYFSDSHTADTMEHAIEKAWTALCSQ